MSQTGRVELIEFGEMILVTVAAVVSSFVESDVMPPVFGFEELSRILAIESGRIPEFISGRDILVTSDLHNLTEFKSSFVEIRSILQILFVEFMFIFGQGYLREVTR